MKPKTLLFVILTALTLTATSLVYEKNTITSELKHPQPTNNNGFVSFPVGGCLVGSGKSEKGFPLPMLSYEYSCIKSPDEGTNLNLANLIANILIYLGITLGGYFLIKRKS